MALQSSGAISLGNLQTEFGGSNPISMSEYYRGGSYVQSGTSIPTSGQIKLSNFYGASAADLTPNAVNWTSASSTNYTLGGRAMTNYPQITGISQSIILRLVLIDYYHTDGMNSPDVMINIDYAFGDVTLNGSGWANLGSASTSGAIIGDVIVNNNANIKFRFTVGAATNASGNMSGTIGVVNASVSPQVTIDTFGCSASWNSPGGGGPIIQQ